MDIFDQINELGREISVGEQNRELSLGEQMLRSIFPLDQSTEEFPPGVYSCTLYDANSEIIVCSLCGSHQNWGLKIPGDRFLSLEALGDQRGVDIDTLIFFLSGWKDISHPRGERPIEPVAFQCLDLHAPTDILDLALPARLIKVPLNRVSKFDTHPLPGNQNYSW